MKYRAKAIAHSTRMLLNPLRRLRFLPIVCGLILTAFSLTLAEPTCAQAVVQIGGPVAISSNNTVARPRGIVAADDGTVMVVWEDYNSYNGINRLYVSAFDGTDWNVLGDTEVNFLVNNAAVEDFEVDSQGRPVVAWRATRRRYGDSELRVSRFEDGVWSVVGGVNLSIDPDKSSVGASLEIDMFDQPMIAWNERFGTGSRNFSYVSYFNGTKWKRMGRRLPDGLRDLEVGVTPRGDEVIYAAVLNESLLGIGEKIELFRFVDGGWVQDIPPIDRPAPGVLFGLFVDMELQGNGLPFVYWTEGSVVDLVPYLVRYRAGDWQFYDTSTVVAGEQIRVQGFNRPVIGRRNRGTTKSSFDRFIRTGPPTGPLVNGIWSQPHRDPIEGSLFQITTRGRTIYTAVYDSTPVKGEIIVAQYYGE